MNKNRLAFETSPYLLQHASNPVDWFPWGEEALHKSKAEDKPILLSIGYSACHWCHVMEHESFEDENVARLMNKNFVCIKVDREERPDIDSIYMDALQAMTGSGGWPLNIFLTPEKKPFYGGTYFPPQNLYNRLSWTQVLQGLADGWKRDRLKIEEQAQTLLEHLTAKNNSEIGMENIPPDFFETAFAKLKSSFDETEGGFGMAPKFPSTFSLQFLLRYYSRTKNQEALNHVLLSLNKMCDGGIYDHIGGGFARYSTDREWLAPHFEKMLYDNALLIRMYAETYRHSPDEKFLEVIAETFDFLKREMKDESGMYYAALDADSEGIEGKFYCWTIDEAEKILGEDAQLFCSFYDIMPGGNWENVSIARRKWNYEEFASSQNMTIEKLKSFLQIGKQKFLAERNKRIRPGLDDKIILSWNALLVSALSVASTVSNSTEFGDEALRLGELLWSRFMDQEKNILSHHLCKGKNFHHANLEDAACFAKALIHCYECSFDTKWLERTKIILDYIDRWFAGNEALYYFTDARVADLLLRQTETYDGAMPSGNSMLSEIFYLWYLISGDKAYLDRSTKMFFSVSDLAKKIPSGFGIWLMTGDLLQNGLNEIAVVGPEHIERARQIGNENFSPSFIMAAPGEEERYPILSGKSSGGNTLIFLCRNMACEQPVQTVKELGKLIL